MDDLDTDDAMYSLNPSTDKLGKDRVCKDATCGRLNALETRMREIELCIEELIHGDPQ